MFLKNISFFFLVCSFPFIKGWIAALIITVFQEVRPRDKVNTLLLHKRIILAILFYYNYSSSK
jgi:hypothetical protein